VTIPLHPALDPGSRTPTWNRWRVTNPFFFLLDLAIALEGTGAVISSNNRRHPRQAGRHSGLAIPVITPTLDLAIGLDCTGVMVASINFLHIPEVVRYTGLAMNVVTPTKDRAIVLERTCVINTCRNRSHTRQAVMTITQ
jgi:hypothetical protein